MTLRKLSVSTAPAPSYPEVVVKHPTCVTCNDPEIVSHTHQHKDKTWGVPSSKPGSWAYYRVGENDEGFTCTCPSFRFRGGQPCKHILYVLGLIAEYRWNDLPASVAAEWRHIYDDFTLALYD